MRFFRFHAGWSLPLSRVRHAAHDAKKIVIRFSVPVRNLSSGLICALIMLLVRICRTYEAQFNVQKDLELGRWVSIQTSSSRINTDSMTKYAFFLALLGILGLSACSSGTPSSSVDEQTTPSETPAPVVETPAAPDACPNYAGVQTQAELTDRGFVPVASGDCELARNHRALALSGVDQVRMDGWDGRNVAVAVIDSGYRVTHEALRDHVLSVAAYHDANANYQLDAEDKAVNDAAEIIGAHGTAVAGLLAGRGIGVAPTAGLWLKALRDENPLVRDVAIAIDDALLVEGQKLVNVSLDLFSNVLIYRTAASDNSGILAAMAQSQAVVVSAAGNSGLDLSDALDDAQSRKADMHSFLDQPAEAAHVLLVGVYDETTQDLAVYSNHPGHRASAQARFAVTAGANVESASSGGDNVYRAVGGTSFSTPIISGALAILLEANPRLGPVEAAKILLETAQRPARLGYGTTCTTTTALGSFSSDCGAMRFGQGILDLPAALARAKAV